MKQKEENPTSKEIPTPPLLPKVLPYPVGIAAEFTLDTKGTTALWTNIMLLHSSAKIKKCSKCKKSFAM